MMSYAKKMLMPKKSAGKPAMPGLEIEIESGEEEEGEAEGEGSEQEMDLKSLMGEEGEEGGMLAGVSDEELMAEVRKRKLAAGGPAEKSAMPEEMPA